MTAATVMYRLQVAPGAPRRVATCPAPSTVAELLAAEAARYLSTVDLFRAEGAPPTWRREPSC